MKRQFETILTVSLAFVVAYLLTRGEHTWMLYASLAVGIPGMFSAGFRMALDKIWFWLAEKIGYVVSRVLLSISFFLIVVPFGLLSRLFRKDLMHMKGGKKSYFIERRHQFTLKDLDNPW